MVSLPNEGTEVEKVNEKKENQGQGGQFNKIIYYFVGILLKKEKKMRKRRLKKPEADRRNER